MECFQRDMTAIISADVTLEQVQAKLAELNQWLPVDGDDGATVGELVEMNSTGPLRLGYGAWRDLLLGCQFRNGWGEVITAGGRTFKNVAGYDLTKFMVGQCGVFGKVVTITTRTYRRPAAALIAEFEPDPARLRELASGEGRPHWMLLAEEWLFCGWHGDEKAIGFFESMLKDSGATRVQRQTIEQDIQTRQELWTGPPNPVFRAAVPPNRLREFIDLAGRPYGWIADPYFGVVLFDGSDLERGKAYEAAARQVGGTVYFVGEREGKPTLAWVRLDDGQRRILHRLKDAFDPEGKLAPLPASAPSPLYSGERLGEGQPAREGA